MKKTVKLIKSFETKTIEPSKMNRIYGGTINGIPCKVNSNKKE